MRLRSDPPMQPEWLWSGFIQRGETVWISGPGKVGKSLLALGLAVAVSAGSKSFLGRAVDHVPATIIDCENSLRTIADRLASWPAAPTRYVRAFGADLASAEGLDALDHFCSDGGLVVLDSMIGLHSIDENNASEVRRLVAGIRDVAERNDATIVGLVHENRGGNTRGSLDWGNAVDTRLVLRKGANGNRTLLVEDCRNGDEGDSLTFRVDDGRPVAGRAGATAHDLGLEGLTPSVGAMAKRIRELHQQRHCGKSKTAEALGTKYDNDTFRKAWRAVYPQHHADGRAIARATHEPSPGGLGSPLTGEPDQPSRSTTGDIGKETDGIARPRSRTGGASTGHLSEPDGQAGSRVDFPSPEAWARAHAIQPRTALCVIDAAIREGCDPIAAMSRLKDGQTVNDRAEAEAFISFVAGMAGGTG